MEQTAIEHLTARIFSAALQPDPEMTINEWADEFRMVPGDASQEPGRWRSSRTPYLKEIMEVLSPKHPARECIVMKGSQLGFTEVGLNTIGYVVDQGLGSMLVVMPTIDIAKKKFTKARLNPTIQATPCLRNKFKVDVSRDSNNTLTSKTYEGGTLFLGGANSAASLSSIPARWLFLDEIDKYPKDLQQEGERRLALLFLDSLLQSAEYTWNEEILPKKVGEYDGHDWVCIVNGLDTVEALVLSNWELRSRAGAGVPEMDAEDRKKLLIEKTTPNVLMAYALASGYFDSDSGQALYNSYREEEIARRIYRIRSQFDWKPTEEELHAYYDAHLDIFQAEKPVRIQQIIFTDSLKGVAALHELSDSVGFDSLAQIYYPGEADIKEAAFDLGWISADEMGEPFFRVVWITEVGEVIGPLRTEWGYHLVKVVGKKDQ